jgi:hypothetical protein
MNQRGRHSTESLLSVVPFVAPLPEPPASLSDSEAVIFRETSAAMPSGWFRADSMPLLVEYSRAVDACNNLSLLIRQPNMSVKEQLAVLASREKQARLVVTLATKMRLTQQSRILPDQAGRDVANKPVAAPPWGGSGRAPSGTSPGSSNTAKSRTAS